MSSVVRVFFLLGDLFFLNLSVLLAFSFTEARATDLSNKIYLIAFSNLTWLFLIAVANPYSFAKSWDGPKTLKDQFIFIAVHLMVVVSLVFFYNRNYSALQIASIYLFFVPAFYLWKLLALFFLRLTEIQEKDAKSILLVCSANVAGDARRYLFENSDWKYNFLGVLNTQNDTVPIDKIQSFCNEHEVDEILVCLQKKTDIKELINFGLNKLIPIKLMADVRNGGEISAEERHFNQTPFINLVTVPLDDLRNKVIKRVFDLIFSTLFILAVMSWLLPIIAILIKMDSRGPVLFNQKRNGMKNRPFMCIKFRTMVVNNEADTKQATTNDTRITLIGKFLRKSSIDEIPQFFNVLLGDMSLIGPRPHPIKLNKEFDPKITKLRSRHYVKPGITGLAQAMGYRGETSHLSDMKNRITLDRFYIENWSFALDLKIIYLTIVSLLRGSEKAY